MGTHLCTNQQIAFKYHRCMKMLRHSKNWLAFRSVLPLSMLKGVGCGVGGGGGVSVCSVVLVNLPAAPVCDDSSE